MSKNPAQHSDEPTPVENSDREESAKGPIEEATEETPATKPKSGWERVEESEALVALEAENADLKDQLLRALAETENVRRRTQKEKEDIGRFAVSDFARDMLSVADNLHRTIEAIPADVLKDEHEMNGLYRGIELVERDLVQAFERHGITKVEALGEKFDHNVHQAMFEVEDPDVEPGTVVQLMAPGYLIHGRLLRPAMVGVAKGGQRKSAGGSDASVDDRLTDKKTSGEGSSPPKD